MTKFRLILIAMTVIVIVLTITAIADGGLNLITPFVGPIFALNWQGQINVDFSFYLIFSGIWMAWRGGFTGGSIALGLLAAPLGNLFFAPYLIYLIGKADGDPRHLLLGVHAAK